MNMLEVRLWIMTPIPNNQAGGSSRADQNEAGLAEYGQALMFCSILTAKVSTSRTGMQIPHRTLVYEEKCQPI